MVSQPTEPEIHVEAAGGTRNLVSAEPRITLSTFACQRVAYNNRKAKVNFMKYFFPGKAMPV